MKMSLKSAALLLPLIIAASALALEPSQQSTASKETALCEICVLLAKETPPRSAKIGSRIYDPRLTCHRELRYTPRAGGKGSQYTMECTCT